MLVLLIEKINVANICVPLVNMKLLNLLVVGLGICKAMTAHRDRSHVTVCIACTVKESAVATADPLRRRSHVTVCVACTLSVAAGVCGTCELTNEFTMEYTCTVELAAELTARVGTHCIPDISAPFLKVL